MTTENISHLNDSIERRGQYLLIDDHAGIVTALNRSDLKQKGFLAVCCTNVEEAVSAILEHNPKILFLDNSLTSGGNEGLELVAIVRERWPNIKIYGTTNNPRVWHLYEELGVELVDKDLEEIDSKLKN